MKITKINALTKARETHKTLLKIAIVSTISILPLVATSCSKDMLDSDDINQISKSTTIKPSTKKVFSPEEGATSIVRYGDIKH